MENKKILLGICSIIVVMLLVVSIFDEIDSRNVKVENVFEYTESIKLNLNKNFVNKNGELEIKLANQEKTTKNYSIYLYIDENDFYTEAGEKLYFQLTNEKIELIESFKLVGSDEYIEYEEVTLDGGETANAYDITNLTGLYELVLNEEITVEANSETIANYLYNFLVLSEYEIVNESNFNATLFITDKELDSFTSYFSSLDSSSIVLSEINNTSYFTGEKADNYIMFDDELYRILNFDSSGNVRLIKNDFETPMIYDDDNYNWEGSDPEDSSDDANINTYLNNDYYNQFSQLSKSIIVKKEVNTTKYTSNINDAFDTKSYNEYNVSLLDVTDYYSSLNNNSSWLNIAEEYTLTLDASDNLYILDQSGFSKSLSISNNISYGFRPVININSNNIFLVSGDGTLNDPFEFLIL